MKYFRVKWIHSFPDEPIEFLAELDDERWEHRKLVIFPDRTIGYADATEESRTGLAPIPWVSLEEIASDPQFAPMEIEKSEFEEIWRNRKKPKNREGDPGETEKSE